MSQPIISSSPCRNPITQQDRELALTLVCKDQGVGRKEVLSGNRVPQYSDARQITAAILQLAGDNTRLAALFLKYGDKHSVSHARRAKKDDPRTIRLYREFIEQRKNMIRVDPEDVRNFLPGILAELPAPYNVCAEKFIRSDVLGDYTKPWDSGARLSGMASLRLNRDLSRRVANLLLVREGPGAAQRMRRAVGLAA